GRSMTVDEALDVPGENGLEPESSHVAVQIHRDAWFVTVGVGDHNSGGVGALLEDRADRRVELRVHEDDVLPVLDRLECGSSAGLDLTGRLDDDVDALATTYRQQVVGHGRNAGFQGRLEVIGGGDAADAVDAGLAEGSF